MKKTPSAQNKNEATSVDQFTALMERFKEEEEVKKLGGKEREQLALLCCEQAAKLLHKPNRREEAMPLFKTALKLDESIVKAHLELGYLYLEDAENPAELSNFQSAYDHFRKADLILKNQGEALPLEAYWKWGVCDYYFARQSEEPLDYNYAVDKMKKAYEGQLRNPGFLIDYGASLGELGLLTGRSELMLEAVSVIKESLEIQGDQPTGWLRLALLYQTLYSWTKDYAYFEKADHSFVAAARSLDESPILWINWGDLLVKEGVMLRDSELVATGMYKLETALTLDPDSMILKARLADACMSLGVLEDDYELLREAKSFLDDIEKDAYDQQEYHCLVCNNYLHMGRYFSDASYYQTAIQKAEKALELHKNYAPLWHALAMAYYALGEMTRERKSLDQAIKFFGQALRTSRNPMPNWINDLGVAEMRLGETFQEPKFIERAIQSFHKAINEHLNKSNDAPDPEWVYNLGVAYDFLAEFTGEPKYYERAIGILSKVLDQFPEYQSARYNLATALYHLGDAVGDIEPLEKAEELFEKLMEDEDQPEREYIMDDYGICLITMADLYEESGHGFLRAKSCFERAESILLESVRMGSQIANYYLAFLFSLTERWDEAVHFLERCKGLNILPPVDVLLQEEWFEELKEFPSFKVFIATLEAEG